MSIADEAENVPYGRHPVVLGSRRDDDWQNLRVMRMPALCWRVTSADIEGFSK